MAPRWPPIAYERWQPTCDTLHAHTQLLGKLAVALAPPEPQLQHAALRVTARGTRTYVFSRMTCGRSKVAHAERMGRSCRSMISARPFQTSTWARRSEQTFNAS